MHANVCYFTFPVCITVQIVERILMQFEIDTHVKHIGY